MVKNSKIRVFALFLPLMLAALGSCDLNKIDYSETDEASIQSEAVSGSYFDDISDMTGTVVAAPHDSVSATSDLAVNDRRLKCAKIKLTIDPNSTIRRPAGTISVDFGGACTDNLGNVRSGKIIIAYSGRKFRPLSNLVVTFDGYSINGVSIEGKYTLTNLSTSAEAHPQLNVSLENGKVTWPDGAFATRAGEFSREWVRTNADSVDVWNVTGAATGTNRAGLDYLLTVKERLVFQEQCKTAHSKFLPSKGKIVLIVAGKQLDVDFGAGLCDEKVVVTIKEKKKVVDLSTAE